MGGSTTGEVLEDGVILKSQAQLAASLTADWSGAARKACEALLARLSAKAGAPLHAALAAQLPKS